MTNLTLTCARTLITHATTNIAAQQPINAAAPAPTPLQKNSTTIEASANRSRRRPIRPTPSEQSEASLRNAPHQKRIAAQRRRQRQHFLSLVLVEMGGQMSNGIEIWNFQNV